MAAARRHSSSCQRYPPRPAAARIDAGQPARGRREGLRTLPLHRRRPSEPGDELLAHARDHLVAEADHVAALGLEGIEDRDAGEHVARDERIDERVDRGFVGEPEQVGDSLDGDRVIGADEDLVEHRLRVAHAAARAARHERERGRLHDAALGLEDAVELAFDLVRRQAGGT